MLQSAKRQECMVDCSQPIAGNYDDFAAQLGDQVPCGKALSQGHEQTADSLNEQALATPGDSPDSPQDFRQAYEAMMSSGGNQRCKRFGKKEGGYFVRRQFAVLCCPQEFCVRAAAGAESFDGMGPRPAGWSDGKAACREPAPATAILRACSLRTPFSKARG